VTDTRRRAEVAARAARAGGQVALDAFRTDLDVETKDGKTDVVTRADRDAQRRVVEVLDGTFPGEPVVGEEGEGAAVVPAEGPAWIVDPVDGTNNYVRGLRVWATSVAAVHDGKAVAAANALPALGDVYVAGAEETRSNGDPANVSDRTDPETFAVAPTIWWDFDRRGEYGAATREIVERFGDLRRFGSAQATLAFVASGGLDAALTNVDPNPWDSIAGVHLIKRAGGTVTDLDGEPWRHDGRGLVASNGAAHGEVLAAARAITGR
jgi:myo-inositol-1(or 4)-monophosphatase